MNREKIDITYTSNILSLRFLALASPIAATLFPHFLIMTSPIVATIFFHPLSFRHQVKQMNADRKPEIQASTIADVFYVLCACFVDGISFRRSQNLNFYSRKAFFLLMTLQNPSSLPSNSH